jgi:hypothetical protein
LLLSVVTLSVSDDEDVNSMKRFSSSSEDDESSLLLSSGFLFGFFSFWNLIIGTVL